MGRRRRNNKLLDDLIRLPWWVGIGGAVVILVFRVVWLTWAEARSGMFAPMMRSVGLFFYFPAAVFAIGGLASLIRQWWHGRLLDRTAAFMGLEKKTPKDWTPASLEPAQPGKVEPVIKAPELTWREFERVIQEAFRRQGYLSVETQSGPDGGYDIALRKDGKLYLVQCKHWKARQVGVAPVRELWGVIAAKGAAGGFFVTSGSFTEGAKAFASTLRMKLIDGVALNRLLAQVSGKKTSVQPVASTTSSVQPVQTPSCPKCGSEMVKRLARKGANAGKEFWGCAGFPNCKGIIAG